MEANFWAVVCATEAAFPLLLGASLDKARQIAATIGAEGSQDFVRDIWILQVTNVADRTRMGCWRDRLGLSETLLLRTKRSISHLRR
jgi:hypothetical protein